MRDQTDRQGEAFRDQVVWITGSSSGIGAALVHAFSGEGACVVLLARRASELDKVKRAVMDAGKGIRI